MVKYYQAMQKNVDKFSDLKLGYFSGDLSKSEYENEKKKRKSGSST